MSSWQIALIDKTAHSEVPAGQLEHIAAALQQQVDNHFAPAWGVRADISAPAAGEVPPPGAWQVSVVDSVPDAGGVHLDNAGVPYAQAVFGPQLSIAISHEVLEMLVDPLGNRFALGPDIDPSFQGQVHEVFYLVEVCDPCEVTSYAIGDVQVSDFVYPSFYNPTGTAPFDYKNTLAAPLTHPVPLHCYISWLDPADWKWHQQMTDGTFGTADTILDFKSNPREARDKAFPDDPDRHNIQAIYKSLPAG
jgi:hypothetical protein